MDDVLTRTDAATINDLDMHWCAWGDPETPLAILLHGFPDTAHTWRHLGPVLADAGFHAVAPWMRGYAPSGLAPEGSYQIGALATDAAALADHFGAGEAVLVGHDWGAITGYSAAAWQPERWKRLVTMAVPPLGSVMEGFFTYTQMRRSWYMFVFQHPLALGAVMADVMAFIEGLWQEWSPGYDATEDLAWVRESLGTEANLAAALAYYQAMLGDAPRSDHYTEIDAAALAPTPVPTLYLHGADDGCMGQELVTDAKSHLTVEGSEVHVFDGVGHFLHLEQPDRINQKIIEFLTA